VTRYQIISGPAESVEVQVANLIDEGWQPLGSVILMSDPRGAALYTEMLFAQAMVLVARPDLA
jgi:hypothetical protein